MIDDPLRKQVVINRAADLNKDGKVDMSDGQVMLERLIIELGQQALVPLTPTYSRDRNFALPNPRGRGRGLTADGVEQPCRVATCGTMQCVMYKKKDGPRPQITWDNDFPFDPNAKATLVDRWNWAEYFVLLTGARVVFPDGAKAYAHFRGNSGDDLTVNYERAIEEDVEVKKGILNELDAVEKAVKEMHDGEEPSFKFHSVSARLVGTVTENWDKAIGDHRVWSTGTVTYDKDNCQLVVEVTIEMEDRYNFNRGQADKKRGNLDEDNGRFEELGWAKSFYSRGKITRKITSKYRCCSDSDCGDETQFDCKCNKCITQCPTQQRSGGQGFITFTVDLKKTRGTFQVSYNMFGIPDELTLFYEGVQVFGTGGLVSGSRTVSVNFGSENSTSTIVTLQLRAPNEGTAWRVSVSCPP